MGRNGFGIVSLMLVLCSCGGPSYTSGDYSGSSDTGSIAAIVAMQGMANAMAGRTNPYMMPPVGQGIAARPGSVNSAIPSAARTGYAPFSHCLSIVKSGSLGTIQNNCNEGLEMYWAHNDEDENLGSSWHCGAGQRCTAAIHSEKLRYLVACRKQHFYDRAKRLCVEQ